MAKGRIGILISGRGSNMVSIIEACKAGKTNAEVSLVISNEKDAPGLEKARSFGVETIVIDHRESKTREEHDAKMVRELKSRNVDLVCLAGYMRILSPCFVQEFQGRIMNIHPALLPAFPGLDVQQKAIDWGVKFSGCTVHFVDEKVDHGPIILQAIVPVLDYDTAETLAARILEEEHRIYPEAVRLFFDGKLKIDGRRVMISQ
ncbi:MAG: phosphoribosylglycinamide formyltransferase [Acidobacteriota bacterium]